MKRHIGKLTNTDQRCVVVYMQIPGREDHALIASTDSMPPRFEQAVMEILESQEGQTDPILANVLARRIMPESNMSVLQAMHEMGILVPVHIDRVVMLPQPNMPFPLRHIIEGMGNTLPKISESAEPQAQKYNPHTANAQAISDENRMAIARNLIIEAEMLENDARRKREQAYAYAPSLGASAEPTLVVSSPVVETLTPMKATDPVVETVTKTVKTTRTAKPKATSETTTVPKTRRKKTSDAAGAGA